MSMFTLTNTEIQRNCYTIELIESGATWSKVAPTPRISPWGGSIWLGSMETGPGPMPARTPPMLPFRSGGGSSCVCIPGIGGNSYVSDAHDAVDMLPWVVLAKLHDLWRLAGQRKTLIKLATTILKIVGATYFHAPVRFCVATRGLRSLPVPDMMTPKATALALSRAVYRSDEASWRGTSNIIVQSPFFMCP
jgi:hypothetical protein